MAIKVGPRGPCSRDKTEVSQGGPRAWRGHTIERQWGVTRMTSKTADGYLSRRTCATAATCIKAQSVQLCHRSNTWKLGQGLNIQSQSARSQFC